MLLLTGPLQVLAKQLSEHRFRREVLLLEKRVDEGSLGAETGEQCDIDIAYLTWFTPSLDGKPADDRARHPLARQNPCTSTAAAKRGFTETAGGNGSVARRGRTRSGVLVATAPVTPPQSARPKPRALPLRRARPTHAIAAPRAGVRFPPIAERKPVRARGSPRAVEDTPATDLDPLSAYVTRTLGVALVPAGRAGRPGGRRGAPSAGS